MESRNPVVHPSNDNFDKNNSRKTVLILDHRFSHTKTTHLTTFATHPTTFCTAKSAKQPAYPQSLTTYSYSRATTRFFSATISRTGNSTTTAAPCGCRLNALISPPCSRTIP